MSRYVKGQSGNPTGKKRGTRNRTTEQLRALIQTFIEGKIDELEEIWNYLEPKEKISFIDRLLKHVLPSPITSIDQFSDYDLDLLIEKLKQKHQNNGQNEKAKN